MTIPHLTSRGLALMALCVVLLVAGTLSTLPALVLASGVVPLAMVASAYLFALRRVRAIDDAEILVRVERPEPERGRAVHRDETFAIVVTLDNGSRMTLSRVRIALVATRDIVPVEAPPELAHIHPLSSSSVDVSTCAAKTGRWVVHGVEIAADDLLGLVRVRAYVAAQLDVVVLPPKNLLQIELPRTHQVKLLEALSEQTRLRRRGFGMDLREIRDYAAGDPYRNIAWKATARTRRLMVRQYEDDVTATTQLLLDVSSTMRGGNGSKFEHALTLAGQVLDIAAKRHDRIGWVAFDDDVYDRVDPATGATHHRALIQRLVALNNVVAGRYTEYDDYDVITAVARYLRAQERLDFRRVDGSADTFERMADPEGARYDADLLRRWIEERIEPESRAIRRAGYDPGPPLAEPDPIRRFAWIRGIPIPYRTEVRLGSKEEGFAKALRHATFSTRDPTLIVVITDLCALMDIRPVTEAVSQATGRHHRVLVLAPFTPEYDSPAEDTTEETLYELFSIAERRERGRYLRQLRAHGAHAVAVGPDADIATLVNVMAPLRAAV